MTQLLIAIAINALSVYIGAWLFDSVSVASVGSAVVVAVLLGLVNAFVRPILKIITIPITILTLGLFLLVLNGAMVLLVDYFVDGFFVNGWLAAIFFSIFLWLCNWALSAVIPTGE